jgi:retron-type reverse transcriptase
MSNSPLVVALAECFSAGHPAVDAMVARASRTLGKDWRWLRPLAERYLARFDVNAHPRRAEAVRFLLQDESFAQARRRHARELKVEHWVAAAPSMQPVGTASQWEIPALTTAGDLARWLQIEFAELQWFADLRGLAIKADSRLGHYHYQATFKRSGAIRLIEAPKKRLKAVQRRILEQILDPIPTHPAAHGFVRGRSIQSFAGPHVGKSVVLRMDVQDFFPSFSAGRILAFFRTAGYPEPVADLLTGLCTNAVPRSAWQDIQRDLPVGRLWDTQKLYLRPHLPQGAPSSPALANLCAWRIDARLAGLAGEADAEYTRYADDLAFSGGKDFERRAERFSLHVAAILLEEGFRAHHRKTRIMRRGVRQYLTGLAVNEKVNVVRADFDRLKATLNNCIRHGAASQNRGQHPDFRGHLLGRVVFVEAVNPQKGARLRQAYEQIPW